MKKTITSQQQTEEKIIMLFPPPSYPFKTASMYVIESTRKKN